MSAKTRVALFISFKIGTGQSWNKAVHQVAQHGCASEGFDDLAAEVGPAIASVAGEDDRRRAFASEANVDKLLHFGLQAQHHSRRRRSLHDEFIERRLVFG